MSDYEDLLAGLAALEQADVDAFGGVAGVDPYIGALTRNAIGTTPQLSQASLALANRGGINVASLAALKQTLNQAKAMRDVSARVAIRDRALVGEQPITFLGIDSVANVLAGAQGVIAVVSSEPCRVIKMTVEPGIAAQFQVNAINVGRISLFMSAVGVPATRWLPDSVRPPMECPELAAGVQLNIIVTNIGAAAARFRGAFDVIALGNPCK